MFFLPGMILALKNGLIFALTLFPVPTFLIIWYNLALFFLRKRRYEKK